MLSPLLCFPRRFLQPLPKWVEVQWGPANIHWTSNQMNGRPLCAHLGFFQREVFFSVYFFLFCLISAGNGSSTRGSSTHLLRCCTPHPLIFLFFVLRCVCVLHCYGAPPLLRTKRKKITTLTIKQWHWGMGEISSGAWKMAHWKAHENMHLATCAQQSTVSFVLFL